MTIHRTRLDQNGRIVIPAEVRRQLGVEPGDEVVLDVSAYDVRLSSHHAAVAALQHMVRESTRGKPYSVAEFLHSRREAALEEDTIWKRRRKRP